ncbi:hydroxymethylpyrimidine/phosphomethylpyrimidine kinase [Fluviicola sp.]|jgi:hydroxymethylpyrimidine/phosphomethylpyrimidine kinase|uniref:hydroxymethylpyrimidine/phosphomethylpyrimidine kinase n=1 Tax=Fluviicola sp. TaxID=1917219 RepID=UPI0028346CD0|nr:hydroxymethylpyrimidine/phosphomethylpyrimidine kinase [Fluviicola sp.]MDR0802766.1 hydroxymethylpyrimidine/phosphomethylpyrimidine kinase [Fluviicola sp.]
MNYNRPIVLSIAGFDPTGGAGALADVKTFEQYSCLGMAVLTGNTNQTETDFISVDWIGKEKITSQLLPILENYQVSAVKIGIVENLEILSGILEIIRASFALIPVVWDPVLTASSGFELHDAFERRLLEEILISVDLITPNVSEARKLMGEKDEIEAAFLLGNHTSVLLKGGHSTVRKGIDLLIENHLPKEIEGTINKKLYPKHGSGCILSAAIASSLALGASLPEACRNAKDYIERRLASNTNLLAYHAE